MNILEEITNDLNWREAEIASMRLLLVSPVITPVQRQVLLRAAWALLYVHYEGFCKNTLMLYYEYISRSGVLCRDLPSCTKILALRKKLTKIRTMNDNDLLNEVADFESMTLCKPPIFESVDTQSNLWPEVLIDLLLDADLNSNVIRNNEIKLKTLVGRRNKIAHGENNIIAEVDYYRTYESAVYEVIYDLAIQVDERLSRPPFVAC